ncbi:hypothetical protein [Halobaculum sp. MBLA0143]
MTELFTDGSADLGHLDGEAVEDSAGVGGELRSTVAVVDDADASPFEG